MFGTITKNQILNWEKNKKIKKLINALESGSEEIRKSSAEALVRIGEPAVDRMLQTCAKGGVHMRWEVPGVLAHIYNKTKNDSVFQNIVKALNDEKDENGWMTDAAAKTLGKLKDQRAEEALINAMLSRHGRINTAVVEALGSLKSPKAVSPLLRNMVDKDNYIQDPVLDALIKIGQPSVDALLRYLSDAVQNRKEPARKAALKALKELKKRNKMSGAQALQFRKLSEAGTAPVKVYRGGAGEPYCSQECYDKGGKYAASVMLKEQSGVCGLCGASVKVSMYGESNSTVVPYEGKNLFVCENCVYKGREFLMHYKKCCMCQRPLDI